MVCVCLFSALSASDIHTVVVILESKPEKVQMMKKALSKVAVLSRQEDSCIEYRVTQDSDNPAIFALFEQWKSKELHAEQFAKPYILDLFDIVPELLAKPYIAVNGKTFLIDQVCKKECVGEKNMEQVRVGIATLVVNDGKILLGKRLNSHGEGMWAPPGGHLEYGETPKEGALRELMEETNLSASDVIMGPWTNDFFPQKEKHYISLFMIVTDFEGEVKLMEPDKCVEWRWFAFDELPEPLFTSIANLVGEKSLESLIHETLQVR
ncbi:MAG: RNA pyrophosphohydrolase [Chlamydiia bacterium]|nr:RNA pyrophosphohydrolase [Chlamydiia bacterium]